jgi:serine/threonine-protein kinase RsbT
MLRETKFAIESDRDTVPIRRRVRELAAHLGFSASEQISVVTAISELAHSILDEAGRGELVVSVIRAKNDGKMGIQAVIRNHGPANPEARLAAQDAHGTGEKHSTTRLPSMRRIVDEFESSGTPGNGSTITIRKWPR